MTTDLITEIRDKGAYVTFNRPEVRNAISRDMLRQLADFLRSISANTSVRYLVFRGNGGHFSAGGDAGGFQDSLALSPAERCGEYERRLIGNSEAILLLSRVNIPVITVTQGAVAGAGLLFTLIADFCLASEDSFFVFAHAKLGLPLDLGLSYFLPRVVGFRAAKSLTLLSSRLDAQAAQDIGLVSQVISPSSLEDELIKLTQKLATGSTIAFRQTKRLLNQSWGNDLATQLILESEAVGAAAADDDFVEGVQAFLDHRSPVFK
ncbi:enoyl-CoA hydratase/isomerase family protein [Haliea sp.]